MPEGSAKPTGQPLDKESLEAGVLIEKGACTVTAGPFLLSGVDGYGLQVLLSDGARLTVFPTPTEPDQPDEVGLPELADWELLSPHGHLKVGPGPKWVYDPVSQAGKDHEAAQVSNGIS